MPGDDAPLDLRIARVDAPALVAEAFVEPDRGALGVAQIEVEDDETEFAGEALDFNEGAAAYAAAADTVTENLPLRVGARVRHARFGEGLVVGIERDGADFVVTVGFASVGRKRLSLQYAHLEEL